MQYELWFGQDPLHSFRFWLLQRLGQSIIAAWDRIWTAMVTGSFDQALSYIILHVL